MSQSEANAIIKVQGEINRQKWEQIRVTAYCSASAFGCVKKSITEFMPFEWDKKPVKIESKISYDERLNRMKAILKNVNGR